jgi:arginase family enzyme
MMAERGHERTYHLLGVPLRTGSLYPGSENDAQAYRDADLLRRLEAAGCRVGTARALVRARGEDVHVLYVDGDIDAMAPEPGRCLSAAAMALWLLTQPSPFRDGPGVGPSRVTVIGWTNDQHAPPLGLGSLALAEVRRLGPGEAARQALGPMPASATILLHLDIDVLSEREVPAAYFPHDEGLTLAEARELLGAIVADPRLGIIEVAEYATLRDHDRRHVAALVDLLASGLGRAGR